MNQGFFDNESESTHFSQMKKDCSEDNKDDLEDEPELTPEQLAEILNLLGLDRKYANFSDQEKLTFLKSKQRINAYDKISTSTNPPRANIDKKKGIVSEVIKNNLIDEETLKKYPSVYIGSGTDIEYPLAMGARKIILVDPNLAETEFRDEMLRQLNNLTPNNLTISDSKINFDFDFGNGPEKAEIVISPTHHNPRFTVNNSHGVFNSPEQIGLVMTYVTQDPYSSSVEIDDDIASKLVDRGLVLFDNFSKRKIAGRFVDKELGTKEKTDEDKTLSEIIFDDRGFKESEARRRKIMLEKYHAPEHDDRPMPRNTERPFPTDEQAFMEKRMELMGDKETTNEVDLSKLKDGSLILLTGIHNRAFYLLEKVGNSVFAWLDHDGSAIELDLGQANSSTIAHPEEKDFNKKLERISKLVVDNGFRMPYFKYTDEDDGRRLAKQPNEYWNDSIERIDIIK